MHKASKIGVGLIATSAVAIGTLAATPAGATTPTLTTVFADNFEQPVVAGSLESLSFDSSWATPGSAFILNNTQNPNATDQTQILGFGALAEGGDAVSQQIAVSPNHTYNLSTAYATDGDDGFLGVRQYDANSVYLGEQWIFGGVNSPGYGQIAALPDSNVWGTYNQDFTPVANTAFVAIEAEDFDRSPDLVAWSPAAYFDNISLGAWNSAPAVTNGSTSTDEHAPKVIDLSALGSDPEGDALTYSIVSGPGHGTLGPVNGGSVTYTPGTEYYNTPATPDSFTFEATDAFGSVSNIGTFSVVVNPVQDPTWIKNTPPSQGAFTNNKSTSVFHAQVTSSDPGCISGRSVTFTFANGALSTMTVLTDASGAAAAKYVVGPQSYTVTTSVAATAACGAAPSGPSQYSFVVKK